MNSFLSTSLIGKNMTVCPLCDSHESKMLELVDSNELARQYKLLTKKNFGALLGEGMSYRECGQCGLRYFDPQTPGSEEFYNALQKFDWYYVDDKYEYSIAQEYIGSGDVVLDVGCGRGRFSRHVESKDGRFIGLEFSTNAKNLAEQDKVEIINESIRNYANRNPETVDVVTSFQVCEHVANVKDFIEAKIQVLKPGGRMIIAVPSEDSYLSSLPNGILNMPPHHITRWPDKVFSFIARKYNLKVESLVHEKIQDYHARLYLSVLIQNSILGYKLLDNSVLRKLVTKFSYVVSKFLIRGFSTNLRPDGHTVLVVFRK